jgi:hypothetical protein
MVSARRQESDRKQAATAAAINRFLLDGTLISISAIAAVAGVSRNFIHSHENLLHQLEAARQTQADAHVPRQRQPTHGAAGRAAVHTELALATQTIKRLRHELAEITARHRLCLGEQIETATRAKDPDATRTTAAEKEHATEENRILRGQVEVLEHRVNDLLDDLTAERRGARP